MRHGCGLVCAPHHRANPPPKSPSAHIPGTSQAGSASSLSPHRHLQNPLSVPRRVQIEWDRGRGKGSEGVRPAVSLSFPSLLTPSGWLPHRGLEPGLPSTCIQRPTRSWKQCEFFLPASLYRVQSNPFMIGPVSPVSKGRPGSRKHQVLSIGPSVTGMAHGLWPPMGVSLPDTQLPFSELVK